MRYSTTLAGGVLALGLLSALPAQGADPTFTKDVAPILFENCTTCHRADEVGPFALVTYEDARKRAKQIAKITEKKIMPPWKPSEGHDTFKNARNLTAKQIATIKAWAEAGAPEGDAKDLPKMPDYPKGWHLGKPDLVIQIAKPFTIPAEGPDIYVHFVLPLDFKEDKYIKAVQVLPSNRKVAHHAVPMLDGSGTARALAKKHGGDHYPNFGGPGFIPRGFLPGYAPGQMTRFDPDIEAGITLAKGSDIVLQMHYHPIGKEQTDQPQIGIYFSKDKPKRNPNLILLGNNDIYIPAGEKEFKRTDSFKLGCDFKIETAWAHMHTIGKKTKVWAELPDGTTKNLLQIDDWDFNWQDTYTYKKPIILPKGTVVKSEFFWDNSADNPRNPFNPPKLIKWGEGSTDEMSGVILGGVTVSGWDEIGMWLAVIGHYFEVEGIANEAKKKREKEGKK